MSFIFSRPKSQPATPAPAPVIQPVAAPVQIARATVPTGDVAVTEAAATEKKKRRGGAGARRGAGTILTGQEAFLGATTGKTLLGV